LYLRLLRHFQTTKHDFIRSANVFLEHCSRTANTSESDRMSSLTT